MTRLHAKRWALTGTASGFAASFLLVAPPASACTATPTTLGAGAVGGPALAGPGSQTASAIASTGTGSTLPFTGAPVVDLLLVAALLLGIGWLLLSIAGGRTPTRTRAAVAGCIVVSAIVGLGSPAGANAPVTAGACAPALTPSVTGIETGPQPGTPGATGGSGPDQPGTPGTPGGPGAPPPVLPEVPFPVLLPLGAFLVIGCVGLRRRAAACGAEPRPGGPDRAPGRVTWGTPPPNSTREST